MTKSEMKSCNLSQVENSQVNQISKQVHGLRFADDLLVPVFGYSSLDNDFRCDFLESVLSSQRVRKSRRCSHSTYRKQMRNHIVPIPCPNSERHCVHKSIPDWLLCADYQNRSKLIVNYAPNLSLSQSFNYYFCQKWR